MYGISEGREYVIKPCAVGYGIYDKPYWYLGMRCEGLYMTSRSLDECIKAIEDSGAKYILQEGVNDLSTN